MIWTYPIYHFLEKHWYDSFLHLYQRPLQTIFGSSSNLVVNSLSLYFQVNNYPFLLTFIRKYRH